jgi:hypothetical protein
MSYKITKSNVVNLANAEKGVLNISKNDKKMMDMTDIKKLNDMMVKKYANKNVKYYIRIFGNLPNPITIKSFDAEYYDEDMLEDYLAGKVRVTKKFEELFSVEIGYIKKNDVVKKSKTK